MTVASAVNHTAVTKPYCSTVKFQSNSSYTVY